MIDWLAYPMLSKVLTEHPLGDKALEELTPLLRMCEGVRDGLDMLALELAEAPPAEPKPSTMYEGMTNDEVVAQIAELLASTPPHDDDS